jgi:hypothetical protein
MCGKMMPGGCNFLHLKKYDLYTAGMPGKKIMGW